MSKIPIFIIGATGYIGGSVLSRLLAHNNADAFDITAIVRSPEKAKKLETFGVKAVVGSFKNLPLMEGLTEQAHVVFSLADSDDLDAIKAILRGLNARHDKTGDIPILIHTSGTGLLTFDARTNGMAVTDTIFDDSNVEQMASIPPSAFHRNVDTSIIQADEDGYAKTYIVFPGTVYGIAQSPLVDAGIQNPYSMQIPTLIKASLARGQAGMVGKGLPLWPSVNIEDTADLHVLLYNKLTASPDKIGHGTDGYYFAENGEHSWYDISRATGKAMVELGLSKTDEPTSFTDEELLKYFGSEWFGNYHGTNSRARATHSRSIGWTPKKTTKDMLASIKLEMEVLLKRQKQ